MLKLHYTYQFLNLNFDFCLLFSVLIHVTACRTANETDMRCTPSISTVFQPTLIACQSDKLIETSIFSSYESQETWKYRSQSFSISAISRCDLTIYNCQSGISAVWKIWFFFNTPHWAFMWLLISTSLWSYHYWLLSFFDSTQNGTYRHHWFV